MGGRYEQIALEHFNPNQLIGNGFWKKNGYVNYTQSDLIGIVKGRLLVEVEHKSDCLSQEQSKRVYINGNFYGKHESILNGDHCNLFYYLLDKRVYRGDIPNDYGIITYDIKYKGVSPSIKMVNFDIIREATMLTKYTRVENIVEEREMRVYRKYFNLLNNRQKQLSK